MSPRPAVASEPPSCRLYLVTPPAFDAEAFTPVLKAALSGGDVAVLQIRRKGVDDGEIARAVQALKPLAQGAGAAVILNDRPDLASAVDCDGVHVGQEDASYEEARRTVGRDRVVGVTCHDSRHLAFEAAEAGADYVAFGAFFDTATKQAPTRANQDLLTGWQQGFETPCVAIGGITVATARGLARAGADFLAVSAGVWTHPRGPAAAVAALNAEMAAGVAER